MTGATDNGPYGAGRSVGDVATMTVAQFRECVEAMEHSLAAPDSPDARRLAIVCADQVRDAAVALWAVYRGMSAP